MILSKFATLSELDEIVDRLVVMVPNFGSIGIVSSYRGEPLTKMVMGEYNIKDSQTRITGPVIHSGWAIQDIVVYLMYDVISHREETFKYDNKAKPLERRRPNVPAPYDRGYRVSRTLPAIANRMED